MDSLVEGKEEGGGREDREVNSEKWGVRSEE
jgi:hypothetical protein